MLSSFASVVGKAARCQRRPGALQDPDEDLCQPAQDPHVGTGVVGMLGGDACVVLVPFTMGEWLGACVILESW